MKQFIILIVLFTGVLYNVCAQDILLREHELHSTSNTSDIHNEKSTDFVVKWIERMYNEKLYEDHDFLQKHCSAKLLKKLQDAYPYDTKGVAYATWLFRSGQQDVKPEAEDKTIMLEIKADGDWFVYTALDMGWKFTNRIKVTNKDGKFVIDDICAVKD